MENENKNLNENPIDEETEIATETDTSVEDVSENSVNDVIDVLGEGESAVENIEETTIDEETTEETTVDVETTEETTHDTDTVEVPTKEESASDNVPLSARAKRKQKYAKEKKNPAISVFMTLIAILSLGTIISLISTPFFVFTSKKYKNVDFTPNRIFDDRAKVVKGWYLDEGATIIFLVLIFFIVISAIMLLKSLGGLIKSSKKCEIYAQKVVFLSFLICSIYFLASLYVSLICQAFFDSKIYYSPKVFVPFLISLFLYAICGMLKNRVKTIQNDQLYFHGKTGRKLGFALTIVLMVALNILALSGLSGDVYEEALISVPFSIIIGIILCVRFKRDINQQQYLDYLAMKNRISSTTTSTVNTPNKVETTTTAPVDGENIEETTSQTEVEVVVENDVKEKLTRVLEENRDGVIYGEFNSVKTLVEDFIEFAKVKGVGASFEDVANIFSAMNSARAVWLTGNAEYLGTLVDVVKEYFGGIKGAFNLEGVLSSSDVIKANYVLNGVAYNLVEELYRAKNNANDVSVSVFSGVKGEEVDELFMAFKDYFRAPNYGDEVDVSFVSGLEEMPHVKNNKLIIPNNWWCFFINDDAKNTLSLGAQQYALSIKISEQLPTQDAQTDKEFKRISYHDFLDIGGKAVSEHFISLDVWNKFDKVVDFLKTLSELKMTNHVYRQIETYSAILISCGEDGVKALDFVLANKIMEIFVKSNVNKTSGLGVSECVDNVFGLENMPVTGKALIDLGIDG